MSSPRRGRGAAVALVLVAAVLWSTGGVGIKSAHAAPLVLAGWRGLFALPLLVAMVIVRARRAGGVPWRRLVASPWPWLGAASYAVMVVAFVVATKLTTAAAAIFIQYASPVYVALLSWPLLRERVSWRGALASAGALLGMLLFFHDGLTASARLGNLVALVSSLGAAGLPLCLRADQERLSAGHLSSAASVAPAFAVAAGDLLAVLACAGPMARGPLPEPSSLGLLALLGMGQIGLPYVLYVLAIPRLTALEGSILPALEPVLNPVWVALGTGEIPGPLAMLGGGFVVASVLSLATATAPPAERLVGEAPR